MFQLAQTVWPRVGGDQANRSRLRIAGPHTAPHWQKTALPVLDETPEHMKKTRNGVIVMPDETLRVCHAGMLIAVTLDGTILWQVDLSNLAREDDYWISSLPTALQTGETLLWQPDKLLLIDRLGTVRTQSYLLPSGNEWANADDSGFSPNLTHNGFLILSAITGEVYFFTDGGWIALSKQQLARLTFDGKELWAREIAPIDSFGWGEQPVVDKDGFIFVRQQEGFLCCDARGRTAFEIPLSLPPQGLMSIVAPGVLAYAQGNELFLGHS